MRVKAEAIRETLARKEDEFTETEAALMFSAELERASEGGMNAPSNDIFRRPRITRKAARAFYLRGFAAGLLAAIQYDEEPRTT